MPNLPLSSLNLYMRRQLVLTSPGRTSSIDAALLFSLISRPCSILVEVNSNNTQKTNIKQYHCIIQRFQSQR